jgi:hypothetical protein
MDSSGADAGDGAGAPATTGAVLRAGTSYYVLNPDGDLPDTQATFEPWLQDALRLQVTVWSRLTDTCLQYTLSLLAHGRWC